MSISVAAPRTFVVPEIEIPSAEVQVGAAACPSCAEEMLGEYCHACGERSAASHDPSLRGFFREGLAEVVDVDSRSLRTLRALLARPGLLTTEHLAGRRRPYVGPLKLFLVVFAVVMFSAILAEQLFPGRRSSGSGQQQMSSAVQRVVDVVAARKQIPVAEAKRELNAHVQDHLSWFILLVPLFFGGVAHAAFRKRRRWFSENLVFATHFAAFNYLFGFLLLPAEVVMNPWGPMGTLILSLTIFFVTIWYMRASVRQVYPGSRWGTRLGAFGLVVVFSFCQLLPSALAYGFAAMEMLYL
jgi:hypothetical protein